MAMAIYAVIGTIIVATATYFSFASAGVGRDARASVTLIAPAGAGGGWDTFMRELQQAMRTNGITNNSQVVNIPGAGGTIGLGKLSTMSGQANVLMVTGSGLVGSVELLDAAVDHSAVRPIARVVEEYNVIVVPNDSPYQTLDDLVQAWKANPSGTPWIVGGTFDQLVLTQLATAAGVDTQAMTVIPKSGGGEVTQALITRTGVAATSGFKDVSDQIEGGRLRALGLASPQRFAESDIPTLTELGYDVTLANWRAVVAPPGITDAEFATLADIVRQAAATPEWQDAITRNQWTNVFLEGPEFQQWFTEQETEIGQLVQRMKQ
ncbi:hypothetical protein KILIM_112_00070 [Kineosphaera limosa NBRC 100340]|uniref:Tricarboxylic transport membrane protein n=2 Tax=Kineosphaera TaxID=211469 RepID=K6WWJ6_9MICO|nr:tripartite tricarboxylate transporter substrate-binding protein [Kineosphaera limosa]GAB98211.1 hypothetical protein KILIM_112_00070 [Kineosphaera limosa NBRC 100340]